MSPQAAYKMAGAGTKKGTRKGVVFVSRSWTESLTGLYHDRASTTRNAFSNSGTQHQQVVENDADIVWLQLSV